MGCGSRRHREEVEVKAEEKWDYINLDDFRTSSCGKPFSYGVLWVLLIISVSTYGIDTFTAINLLAFNRLTIEPYIPLRISKWIFTGCIILSFVILAFEWLRAIRVIKRGGVAESYLDPLAVRVQSIRPGKKGKGWRRFLVFTLLTRSRGATEYVALFAYFSFKTWIRLAAEAPRQVVNALTLWSVVQAKLVPNGPARGHTPIAQFFINLRILASTSPKIEAVVLGGMAWTLLVWVFRVLSLLIAVLLYLVFLWHHIPGNDGGLTGYLTRKVDAKVRKIVAVKVQKALDKENALRDAEDAKAAKDGSGKKFQPTVPTLDGFASTDELVMNAGPISKYQSESSLPSYSSRRSSQVTLDRQPTPLGEPRVPFPVSRTNTMSSNSTTNAPFINNNTAGGVPYNANAYSRSNTIKSDRSLSPTYDGGEEMMHGSLRGAPRGVVVPTGRNSPALPQEFRQGSPSQMGYGPPMGRGPPRPRMDLDNGPQSPRDIAPTMDPYSPLYPADSVGRGGTPAPIYNPRTRTSPGPGPGPTYTPYGNPNDPSRPPPRRNMTAPRPLQASAGGMYFPPQPTPRSATAPLPGNGYEDLEMQTPARGGSAWGTRGNDGWDSHRNPRVPFEGGF